jgi:hypothetical protein
MVLGLLLLSAVILLVFGIAAWAKRRYGVDEWGDE